MEDNETQKIKRFFHRLGKIIFFGEIIASDSNKNNALIDISRSRDVYPSSQLSKSLTCPIVLLS